MTAATATGNVIEENTSVGNSNGIYLPAGVQGNTVRRNVLLGNPPVQVAVDHAADTAFDIKNLATPGANVFDNNVCLTALNAPCPALEPSLTASPNPIPVSASAVYGMTALSWTAPGAEIVEVRIGSPNGTLFAFTGSRGSAQTGPWVTDGMTFYLQDITGGKPLTAENTLATLVIRLQRR
jgi:parallel beta-helix repeat protein